MNDSIFSLQEVQDKLSWNLSEKQERCSTIRISVEQSNARYQSQKQVIKIFNLVEYDETFPADASRLHKAPRIYRDAKSRSNATISRFFGQGCRY